MAEDKIRIGIIGANANYGWSMRAHLPALLALPEYELAAVCTSRKETAEESAKHYGAGMAFHDYGEMVQHPDIDLVAVSVRVPLHHDMVMAALQAGKNVFCEWPLGANLGEADQMAKLATSKGVSHMVGLQARGDPVLLRLKELVAGGYVGEVLLCNMTMFLPGILQRGADRAWSADRRAGANTLTIGSGHSIDALCFCVGDFKEVSARVAVQVPEWAAGESGKAIKVDAADNVLINGVLINGAVASVHVSTVPWHGTGWRIEVYGREGTLTASSQEMVQYARIQLRGGKRDGEMQDIPIPDSLTWVPSEVPQGAPFNVAQLYRRLGEAMRQDKIVEPDFQLAVRRHRLLDAIQRSSDQGVAVQV